MTDQKAHQPIDILLVDDDADNRMLITRLLGDEFRVHEACSAEECLNMLPSHEEDCIFNVVLMDLIMPGMGGIEGIRKMRECDGCLDIPVIVITADDTDHALEQAFLVGANDYIAKPVRKVELHARVYAAVRLMREMNIRKQREAELQRRSLHDPLTSLPNRRYFNDSLGQEWRRMLRMKQPMTLVMVDIDDFKAYNDHLGHPAGDGCLCHIAKALLHAARRPGDMAARWGGEEFVLLLPDTDVQAASAIAKDLLTYIRTLALPHPAARAAEIVTASMGVATLVPQEGMDTSYIVDVADRALYTAKAKGRNQFFVESTEQTVNEAVIWVKSV